MIKAFDDFVAEKSLSYVCGSIPYGQDPPVGSQMPPNTSEETQNALVSSSEHYAEPEFDGNGDIVRPGVKAPTGRLSRSVSLV